MKLCLATMIFFDEASGKCLCSHLLNEMPRCSNQRLKKGKNLEGNEIITKCRKLIENLNVKRLNCQQSVLVRMNLIDQGIF